MDANTFRASLNQEAPPADASPLLAGLWHAWRGDWDRAHDLVNQVDDIHGAWLHAHLHREEGDLSNADYWYRHAGRSRPDSSLQTEREAMLSAWLCT